MSTRPRYTRSGSPLSWLIWGACGLLAAGVCLSPEKTLLPARKLVLDLAGKGLEVSVLWQQGPAAGSGAEETGSKGAGSNQAAQLELANRQLQIQAAELQRQLQELAARASAPLNVTPHSALVQHTALESRVLGQLGLAMPERQLVINLGAAAGLRGEELVISHADLLIDLGTDQGLSPDDLVLTGQTLWGRIVQSGRWTSTVRRITDVEFRTAVRLVRSSPQGPVFGARGILVGSGTGCRVEQVAATEPVSIGDHIYTDSAVTSPQPLYCGVVTSAELAEADSFWKIDVRPAAEEQPSTVVVLRPVLNALRLSSEPAGSP